MATETGPLWGPPTPSPAPEREWYRRKRYVIPAFLLVCLTLLGIFAEPAPEADTVETTPAAAVAERAADQAAEDAERAAEDLATATTEREAAEAARTAAETARTDATRQLAAARAAAAAAATDRAAAEQAARQAATDRAAAEAARTAAARQAADGRSAPRTSQGFTAPAGQPAARPAAPPAPAPEPAPAGRGTDPRFSSCKDAKAAGYGGYRQGQDPEYAWYRDGDGDGVACE